MAACKLLIADHNEDFRLALAQELQTSYFVRCCGDGYETARLLRQDEPDILILDLALSGIDGLTVLEDAVHSGIRPMVMILGTHFSPYVLETAQRLGVDYAMRKPVDLQAVIHRVQDLNRRLKPAAAQRSPAELARHHLDQLRILPKYHGYEYLAACLVLAQANPRQAITKELYPAAARQCGCDRSQIERSIRNAIEKAWQNRNESVWLHYFPHHTKRPTNGDFIKELANILHKELTGE